MDSRFASAAGVCTLGAIVWLSFAPVPARADTARAATSLGGY